MTGFFILKTDLEYMQKNTLNACSQTRCGTGASYTSVLDWEHNIPPIEETKMFTVLSNTRNSNLFLIGALVIAAVALLTLVVVPAISVPQPVAKLSPAAKYDNESTFWVSRMA